MFAVGSWNGLDELLHLVCNCGSVFVLMISLNFSLVGYDLFWLATVSFV